jgi:hypothetical protein
MKNEKTRIEWLLRPAAIAFGSLLIYSGWDACRRGVFWIVGYNPRTGTPGVGPTLGFFYAGIVCVLLGLLPWKTIGRVMERFMPRLKKRSR